MSTRIVAVRYFITMTETGSIVENYPALLTRAQRAALGVARDYGLRSTDPTILAARSNLIIHLRPAPVVARVALGTAILRPDVREWFGREVAVAGFLAGQEGVGVVPPSDEIPPGPHEHDGMILSFWRLVPSDPERRPSVAEAGRALQELHRALRNFPGELPDLAPPLIEVPRLLDRIEHRGDLSSTDLARLRDACERLAPTLRSPA